MTDNRIQKTGYRRQKSDNRLLMIDDSILVIQVSYFGYIVNMGNLGLRLRHSRTSSREKK